MKLLMTMMIHQLSVTSNKVSSQLISPQNWPVFIFPLTQSEPDIYHLNSTQSLKKFPVVLTCTYFSFYLSCGPRGIFYYLESITWSFHNHMCLLHYSRLNSSHSKDIYVNFFLSQCRSLLHSSIHKNVEFCMRPFILLNPVSEHTNMAPWTGLDWRFSAKVVGWRWCIAILAHKTKFRKDYAQIGWR